ncbi:unnamed protein product [Psylliodes chrysocephalus]|uniref:K Homology domain-containing protein n=1 Tax=Psylliodes chrysocephalus TaxID=3402493 RepID=A0A9P0G7W7_9CUCU|nr:unnamed protein product [Psylliodes chrysocephala]
MGDEWDSSSQTYSRGNRRDGGGGGGYGSGGGGSGYREGRRDDGYRNSNSGGQNWRDDKFEVMYVPSMKVGRVIGRGGSKINELQSESGARIQVTKDIEGEDTLVKLFGDESCITKAKELITELTTEYRQY